ncbi:hypothetical protein HZ326_8257 [Fusarium oxysporum f. sp. albedinis]|nr:hypothetical protein HZ326_8257 [Fusarium oxysporum f. sp. albedinis]
MCKTSMPWLEDLDGAIDAVVLYSVSLFGLREMAESSRIDGSRDTGHFGDFCGCCHMHSEDRTVHAECRSS